MSPVETIPKVGEIPLRATEGQLDLVNLIDVMHANGVVVALRADEKFGRGDCRSHR